MSDKVKIAVDAMGGENAPRKIINAIEYSLSKNNENFFYIFGNEEAIKKVALKRPAEPEEISNVIMFLASDLSSYINGEVIFVTGGY